MQAIYIYIYIHTLYTLYIYIYIYIYIQCYYLNFLIYISTFYGDFYSERTPDFVLSCNLVLLSSI